MYAGVDGEREVLSNILHELQAVDALIDKAQAQSEEDARREMGSRLATPHHVSLTAGDDDLKKKHTHV